MLLSSRDFQNIRLSLEVTSNYTEITKEHQEELLELKDRIFKNDDIKLEFYNELHPTEVNYPEMTTRFREIQAEMYEEFLRKNNDYSRWNILGTGIVGLATRFWDKTARIMNLVGFNIGTGEYTAPKENMVEDERIEKTFMDASVYGIIARIYLEGKWGK